MAQTKKRPSKAARAAQKILEDSKLLATSKSIIDTKADQEFKPNESAIKTAGAIKPRPNKKRG
jgi:hypothetical protein